MICCVVGLGYVGLPVAGLIANAGIQVVGCDTNIDKLKTIRDGDIFEEEKDVQRLIKTSLDSKNLLLSNDLVKADIYFVCVPTPLISGVAELPEPDISYVIKAIKSIGGIAQIKSKVIIESTCPLGTTEFMRTILLRDYGLDLEVYYCPERVLPGNTISELCNNSRIVGISKPSDNSDDIVSLYKEFVKAEIVVTDAKVAEMVKLVENSYRDLNIAFANQLQSLCDKLSMDSRQVISLANRHPRVDVLSPGIGVGGHCIPIDPWFLVAVDPLLTQLSVEARHVNLAAVSRAVIKIFDVLKSYQDTKGKKPTVALFGLSYKPDIADFRESPAMQIMKELKACNIDTIAVQPKNIAGNDHEHIFADYDEALTANIAVKLVNHSEFDDILITDYVSQFEVFLDLT